MTDDARPPLISVILLTYNHEPFLAQAVEGVLAQTTACDVELLISEDCSTDGTRAMVAHYGELHPGRVRTFLSPQNQNDNDVFLRAYRAARGDFVAYLDGDDYWTSPSKLQTQVDFLLAHPQASGCFHAVDVVEADGALRRRAGFDGSWLTTERLMAGNPVKSPSPLLRRSALGELPPWFEAVPFVDWPLYVVASQSGDIGYLDESMAAYRKHSGGHWSGMAQRGQVEAFLEFYRLVVPSLPLKHRRQARPWVAGAWAELALTRAASGEPAAAARALSTSLALAPLAPRSAWRRPTGRAPRLRTVGRLLGPRTHRVLAAARRWLISRP